MRSRPSLPLPALLVALALALAVRPLDARAEEGYLQALQDGEPVCLIAALTEGAIEPLRDPDTPPPPRGAGHWRIVTLSGLFGEARGGAPALDRCGCQRLPRVALEPPPRMTGLAVATNLTPGRIATVWRLPDDDPVLRHLARQWLAEQEITQAPVRLTGASRLDLEGDGVDELLLAGAYNAMAVSDADREHGRYAFLLLARWSADGWRVAGDLQSYVDPAPYGEAADAQGIAEIEPVMAMDLTGDGIAEVVLGVWTGEALLYELYRFETHPGLPAPVLDFQAECGCGC